MNAPVLKTVSSNAQTIETTEVCDAKQDCLGVLLGALRAESPDLAAIIEAWPILPNVVKTGIKAMIDSAVT